MTTYKPVKPGVDLPGLERKILEFWKETNAFERRVDLNKDNAPWSFIDGPITANNPMGVHHAWGRTYKDLYQRFNAMKENDLRYQNGFDCQGLWVEVEVEKEYGFKSKRDIEAFGIAQFVNKCKQRVLKYAAIQVEQSIRLGYWMDWDDVNRLQKLASYLDRPQDVLTVQGLKGSITGTAEQIVGKLGTPEFGGSYFTFSDENNYTIWKVLKKCHEHGWIYKGLDVMPWCPRCSTALSQHEIATEGYRELTHPGIVVKFPLKDRENASLLVWTTTPWTLTANIAAAVHPNLTYVKIYWQNEILYLAENALDRVFASTPQVSMTLNGKKMEGWTYTGPFDELSAGQKIEAEKVHRVILWNEISETEGTGIVHIAPGCGKEDFDLSKKYHLPAIAPLDEYGVFLDGFGWLSGSHVYDSAKSIIDNLQEKNLLFKEEDYTHRYPVCWRCGNELVFRLVSEWFISMGQKLDISCDTLTPQTVNDNLRYQIMEVTKKIRWIPPYGLQQELDWLRNMDDWMISKKRYWGLALPIWECDSCHSFDVIGSETELKSRAVAGWNIFDGHAPHRPWVDAVKILCPTCGSQMSRIEDVGNPWLDAGIVAYSTLNYRHNREHWQRWFPADLICESLPGQFRNWFYSMLAMSTILERKPPFLTCLGHGLVFAEDGREMHKSWGNAIWFDDAVETMGADVMRWMYCQNKADTNLLFGYKRAEEAKRQFFIPLWNIYSFFVTYANLDEWTPKDQIDNLSSLDRWILAKLHRLIQDVTNSIEAYDAYTATSVIRQYVNELSTWYIRRSRRRFWKSESDSDKKAAYTTLYTCLKTLITLLAPFCPFLTEEIYQNIVRSVTPRLPESIHHNRWPVADPTVIKATLLTDMDLVIKVSSLGRAARNRSGLKLRQPLAEAQIVTEQSKLPRLRQYTTLIAEELNVKKISLSNSEAELLDYQIRLLPSVLGKKYGILLPKIQTAIAVKDAKTLALSIRHGKTVTLEVDGQIVTLLPSEMRVETQAKDGWVIANEQDFIVGVNIHLNNALVDEGLAKDIVRRIQNQRKNANFNIADKIETYYEAGSKLTAVFEAWGEYIAKETLTTVLRRTTPPKAAYTEQFELAGEQLLIGLARTTKVSN
jgi:isoleucyl-tRNA synthetase